MQPAAFLCAQQLFGWTHLWLCVWNEIALGKKIH